MRDLEQRALVVLEAGCPRGLFRSRRDAGDLEGAIHDLALEAELTRGSAGATLWSVASAIRSLIFIWPNLGRMNFPLLLEHAHPLGHMLGVLLHRQLGAVQVFCDLEQSVLVVLEAGSLRSFLRRGRDAGDLQGALSFGSFNPKLASRGIDASSGPMPLSIRSAALNRRKMRRLTNFDGLRLCKLDPLGDLLIPLQGREVGPVQVLGNLLASSFNLYSVLVLAAALKYCANASLRS